MTGEIRVTLICTQMRDSVTARKKANDQWKELLRLCSNYNSLPGPGQSEKQYGKKDHLQAIKPKAHPVAVALYNIVIKQA